MAITTKIIGIGNFIPGREISNDFVLGRLLRASRPHLDSRALEALSVIAQKKMAAAGCRTRYWCGQDEYCTDIAFKASRMAMDDAGIRPREIDYVIFTGMSKAFVEPASGHVLRHALRAERANVIDTQDACTSFIKSLHIADCLIRSGACRTILIAAGERTFDWADFECTTLDDLDWKFGSLTIGDGAGALVLQATQKEEYCRASYHFDLTFGIVSGTFSHCHIGLNHAVGERYKLKSHSKMLFETATLAAWDMIQKKTAKDPDWSGQAIDRLLFHDIGHYLARKALPDLARFFPGIPADYPSYFSRLGNVASASLPVGLSLLAGKGQLKRGDHVMFMCPAGGVQAGILTFTY